LDASLIPLVAIAPTFAWGFADYLAGSKGRQASAVDAVVWSQFISGVLVVALAVATGTRVSLAGGLPAALGGAAGVAGLACFYRAMQLAPIATVAPLVASGVGLPVMYGLVVGGGIGVAGVIGMGIGLVGVFCITTATGDAPPTTRSGRVPAMWLAAGGAIGYGLFLTGVAVADSDPFNATLVARIGATVASIPIIAARLLRNEGDRLDRPPVSLLAMLGVLDAVGVLTFASAAHHMNIAVASVLASLYPAVTVCLAIRSGVQSLSRRQAVGVALTLVAVPMLAAGAR
jgi:drug/metabolite transporter (DMT)-like permease